MTGNRGVVYARPGQVEAQGIPFPELSDPRGRKIEHGVILKVVTTNICGSDQHMVRGRTTAPSAGADALGVPGLDRAGTKVLLDGVARQAGASGYLADGQLLVPTA